MLKSDEKEVGIKRTTLSQQVSEYLLAELCDGSLRPGDRLPTERDLMRMLSVGRSSVREALHALVMMNLIDVQPGRGAVVQSPGNISMPEWLCLRNDIEDHAVEEILETRKIIEVQVVSLAAQRATAQDIAVLHACLEEHRRLRDVGVENPELRRADLAFHEALAKAAHNAVMLRVLIFLTSTFAHLRTKTLSKLDTSRERILQQHEQILIAIEHHDEQAAQRAMLEHLETGQRSIRDSGM